MRDGWTLVRLRPLSRNLALWVVLCVAGLILAGPLHAQSPNLDRPLVAVLALQPVGATKAQAAALTDRLGEALLDTGRFTLVDRSQIDDILKEQAFQETGCTAQECAVQVGRILGVRRIVAGKVERVEANTWLLSAILVDVETAQTLQASSVVEQGSFVALLTTGVDTLAKKLVAKTITPLGQEPAAATTTTQPPPPPKMVPQSAQPPPAPVQETTPAAEGTETDVASSGLPAWQAWLMVSIASAAYGLNRYQRYKSALCTDQPLHDSYPPGCNSYQADEALTNSQIADSVAIVGLIGLTVSLIRNSPSTASRGFQVEPSILPEPGRPALALAVSRRW